MAGKEHRPIAQKGTAALAVDPRLARRPWDIGEWGVGQAERLLDQIVCGTLRLALLTPAQCCLLTLPRKGGSGRTRIGTGDQELYRTRHAVDASA